jgi:hypothetical protein
MSFSWYLSISRILFNAPGMMVLQDRVKEDEELLMENCPSIAQDPVRTYNQTLLNTRKGTGHAGADPGRFHNLPGKEC